MTRKFAILLVLTVAALFLGLCFTAFAADTKKVDKKAAEVKAQAIDEAVARSFGQKKDMLRWDGVDVVAPGYVSPPRSFAPSVAQSVSPFITMHVGAREADNNGSWKRHAVVRGTVAAGRTVHVLYPTFDSTAGPNSNRHKYNCLASGAVTMTYNNPEGTNNEPNANPTQADQNGGIHASHGNATSAQEVWAGRGIGANTGTIYNEDASSCAGLITTVNTPVHPPRGLDPDIRVVSSGVSPDTIVVFVSNFNGADIGATTSQDGGATWSPVTPVIVSSFLNFAVATRQGSPVIHVFSMGLSDSSAGDDNEEILYTKSTTYGLTWSPTVSVSGPYLLPSYIPQFNGSITAIMIGDTAHCVWADHTHGTGILPGGHIQHLAVEPSGAVQGPHRVADINIYYDVNNDYSATGFGLGHGLWAGGSGPSVARSASSGILYALWGAPPEDPAVPGKSADSTATAAMSNGRVFYNNDIWCAASATNGRNWDAKTNITLTNNNNCNGTVGNPCAHEFYFSAAEAVDSVIYCVAQVNQFPGFFALGAPDNLGPDTRLRDEWRLYLFPARGVQKTASCDFKVTSPDNISALEVHPGLSEVATFGISNGGLVDLKLDSIVFTGTLNGAQLVTSRTGGINIGDAINQLETKALDITFNATGVSQAQSGLRTGQIQIWTHTDDTVGLVGPKTALCQVGVNVYVVSNLCLNSADTVHSLTNFTEVWSQSVEVFAASLNGMFYFATSENFIFDGGKAIYNPSLAGPPNHPRGLRNYFDDQFLRCLSPITVDSIPDPTDPINSDEIFAKCLSTGRFDSTIIWETIWRQSTNPAYSDFLCITNKVVNISGADLPDVVLGHTNDIDVPTNFNRTDNGMTGPANLSYDTTFTATNDGKQYRMLVLSGVDTTGESGTTPPHFCTSNDKYFGVLVLPNGMASTSPVQARGAVIHNNRTLVLGNQWVDSTFTRNLDAVGYHTARDLGDPLTGMDTIFTLDSCPNGGGVDIGYIVGAKKVTLPNNPQVISLLTTLRGGGGLSGLAASMDTLTLPGPSESYCVILVASLNDVAALMEAADSAISWCNITDGVQEGIALLGNRGDGNASGLLTSADVVLQLNKTFLGQNPANLPPDCVFDLNIDGIITSADVVLELNYVFLGTLPVPNAYPALLDLLGCQ